MTLVTPSLPAAQPPAVSAASDVLQVPWVHPFRLRAGAELGDFRKNGGRTVDFFSRSGLNLVGILLLLMILSAVYALWDITIRRWFG